MVEKKRNGKRYKTGWNSAEIVRNSIGLVWITHSFIYTVFVKWVTGDIVDKTHSYIFKKTYVLMVRDRQLTSK